MANISFFFPKQKQGGARPDSPCGNWVWTLTTAPATGWAKASIDNLWRYGGFFATGWNGLILSLAVIMFSFGVQLLMLHQNYTYGLKSVESFVRDTYPFLNT